MVIVVLVIVLIVKHLSLCQVQTVEKGLRRCFPIAVFACMGSLGIIFFYPVIKISLKIFKCGIDLFPEGNGIKFGSVKNFV